VAGPPDSPADGQRLIDLVRKHRLHDRVQLELGFHPREQLARWVNRSLASAYMPFDEDYGYVTLEAFYAGKPVLTSHDSGGVLDFVRTGETGLIAAPDPQAMAAAIDQLSDSPAERRQWGEAARAQIQARNINWPETVKRLVA
jgi:glycosyltransferase involved in cell wall biosynthesis